MAVILIVEDEVFIHDVAKITIEGLGHDTLSASDLDEALLALGSAQHIDALFTDIRLKTAALGGYELARQAVNLRPRLRVLYATGNSITEGMKAMFVEGACFLQKPYDPLQLQNSLEGLLAAAL